MLVIVHDKILHFIYIIFFKRHKIYFYLQHNNFFIFKTEILHKESSPYTNILSLCPHVFQKHPKEIKYFILIWLFLSNIHDFALKFEIGVCDTCISVHIVKKNRKNVQKYFFFCF